MKRSNLKIHYNIQFNNKININIIILTFINTNKYNITNSNLYKNTIQINLKNNNYFLLGICIIRVTFKYKN